MAVQQNDVGVFETVLRMTDEASPVVKKFGNEVTKELSSYEAAAQKTTKSVEENNFALNRVSGEVDKATNKAKKTSKSLTDSVKDNGVQIMSLAKTIGWAGAAGALTSVQMAISGMKAADALGKQAQKLNMTAEAFQIFNYQAGLSDITMGQVSNSISNMMRNISKAADDAKGPLKEAFDAIGLNAKDLKGLAPEDQVGKIVDALEGLADVEDRIRYGRDIFGKNGEAFITAMEGGTKAIANARAEVEAFGGLMTDAATKDADVFFDNLSKFSNALGSIKVNVTNTLAGDLRRISDALLWMIKDAAALKAFTVVLEALGKTLLFLVKIVASAVVSVVSVVGDIGRIAGGILAALSLLSEGKWREAGRAIGALLDDLKKNGLETAGVLKNLWGIVEEAEKKDPGTVKRGAPGRQMPDYLKKQSFEGDQWGGGFVKTAMGDDNPMGIYSDVVPGAELVQARLAENREVFAENFWELEEMTQKHHIRLRNYDRERNITRFTMGQYYDKLSLQSSAFFFGQLGALMQTQSRRLFEIGKAGAIAETIIQTYRAAQGAYAAMASIPFVGPALGAAAAAAAIAVGFARVQAINSTQYGSASGSPVLSSGGFSGPVVSGDAAVVPVAPAPVVQAPRTPRQQVNIYLTGEGSPTQTWLRDVFVPNLNEVLGDGVELNVRAA